MSVPGTIHIRNRSSEERMLKKLKKKTFHILLSQSFGHSSIHLATVGMIKRRKTISIRYMETYLDNWTRKKSKRRK